MVSRRDHGKSLKKATASKADDAYTGYLSKDRIDELEDAVKAFSKIKAKEDYILRRGRHSGGRGISGGVLRCARPR